MRAVPGAASGMPKYVVHIGLTKTGTTHLQGCLRALRTELADAGILYPNVWWSSPKQVNHVGFFEALTNPAEDQLERIFDEFNASSYRIILLSCEGLSGLPREALLRLRNLMEGAECEIILYCRRWSDWIPSHWQQTVKGGGIETFPLACARILNNPFAPPVNFGAILDLFGEVFGQGALRLVSYSNLMDSKTDLLRHFCSAILRLDGIESPFIGTPFDGAKNESTGIYLTELIRHINVLNSGDAQTRSIPVSKILVQNRRRPELKQDLDAVLSAMEPSVDSIRLDDNQSPLGSVLESITKRYHGALINSHLGNRLFNPRSKEVRYVREDYLAAPATQEVISRIWSTVQRLETEQGRQISRSGKAI
jgi:hypothetical protein